MKIGFVINDLLHEPLPSSTIQLALTATKMGHEVWLMGVGDFVYNCDEMVHAHARSVETGNYSDQKSYYGALCADDAIQKRITVDDLDILMLRNDPAQDIQSSWAQHAAIVFGRTALRHGVIVLNDPDGLSKAINKMYFQHFPKEVRVEKVIARNVSEIERFYEAHDRNIIIKPLMGSAGRNVFFVQPTDAANLHQMADAVFRDGYAIAEAFLPEALNGDVRLFLMNGAPLQSNGRYCAFRRIPAEKDIRSNIHAGGRAAAVEVTDEMLRIAEIVRPKLVQDGMFLVGLDIVGDKLLEINVFSPGGLHHAHLFKDVDFSQTVIEALEKKVLYMQYYRRNFDNIEMNTL
ncbi:glutathione synthetase [Hydrogenimonas cancrithermarum]|uniref:Glutathione synthetase n=1 Tax=Hydrogenimonas cancrithermarum TaxID=2993563 RepID=A0ABM8FJ98_9BACT|nr:glutathione synthetase [Hydrogenimonas cancrithermarum]BDY12362.1 glutathione synthetase [Hydrogenimonas cancrithermarum]